MIAAGFATFTAEAQQGNTINVAVSGIIANGQATCTFNNVPPGTYAVACFKAAPGQTKMKTGTFGMP